MMPFLRKFWPWLAAGLSGGMLALAFPPWNQEWLAWVGLAPLFAAVWFGGSPAHGLGGRRALFRNAALGYLTGLCFFLPNLHWITTVHWAGWIALCLFLALYPAAWAAYVGAITRETAFLSSGRNLLLAAGCASGWAGLEWIRGWLFSGFGWNGLGVALHANTIYIQAAEWTGVAGLSFMLAFCSAIGVITVRRFASEIGRRRMRPHYDFSVAMVLLAVVFAFGFKALIKPETGEPLKVAAVQANIPQNQKWDAAFERGILDRYEDLTSGALALGPDLLLWPEAATPRPLFADREMLEYVLRHARQTGGGLLIGTLDFDPDGDYNAAVLFTGKGERMQSYRKLHLVPFGEFIPFRQSFPLFDKIAGDLVPGDFVAGTEHTVFRLDDPPAGIAPLICFEDTLGDLVRRFVLGGAQVLVDLTNDGWFLESPAAEQHLANALFRAVETRRPLLRAANTGVTCFVNSKGVVTHALRDARGRTFIEGILSGRVTVPPADGLTFYVRYGDWFPKVCCAVGLVALATGLVPLKKNGKEPGGEPLNDA